MGGRVRVKRSTEDKDDDKTGGKKKKRKPTKVKNPSQPESCKLQTGETWATHFANKGVNDWVDWAFQQRSGIGEGDLLL
jgi:hypothetical protein